jgi:type I restriction enzyme M protein
MSRPISSRGTSSFGRRAHQNGWRRESERFRRFTCDELIARDEASLDVFRLRDESLEDSVNLPPPAVIPAEIAEGLEAALDGLAEIAASLRGETEWG